MSNHIGSIGAKVSAEVTLDNIFQYEDFKYSYYGTTHYTYIMQDADGNVLVWKTTSCLMIWDEVKQDNDIIRKGDTLVISGKVKEHTEYKGVKQTVLTRCKYSLVSHAPTQEELDAQMAEEQKQSLKEGDFIWEMPYRQFKEHYSDCETVAGSFDRHLDPWGRPVREATIKVIIRDGRLKSSGVRGKRFYRFWFTTDHGTEVCYRAVCEENARKQMLKEYPNSESWKCTSIE
jgi:hypothetical protein